MIGDRSHAPRGNASPDAPHHGLESGRGASRAVFPRRAWEQSSLSALDLDLPDVSTAVAEQAPAQALPMVSGDLRQATEHYQRQLISACLERHQHNWASAARELGLDRANLGRMAKRLGLK